MDDKISVIVPFYTGEKYFIQCLESISRQTYEDLEILLIDDGSIDRCSKIAREFADNDSRFKLIKQTNAGVSVARNAGLAQASGKYIMFVDSDDIIASDAIKKLHDAITENDCDVAIASFAPFIDEIKDKQIDKAEIGELLDNSKLMAELAVCHRIQNFVWGKLYKRHLFATIGFPIGKTFEDIAIMYQVFALCHRGYYIPQTLFFYRQNPHSLSHTIDQHKMNDYCSAMSDKARYYLKSYPDIIALLAPSFFDCCALAITHFAKGEIASLPDFMVLYSTIVRRAKPSDRWRYRLCKFPALLRFVHAKFVRN